MKKVLIFLLVFIVCIFSACESTKDTDIDKINKVLQSINIPEQVTTDLDLKTTYELDSVICSAQWQSLNSSVISNTGEITFDVYDREASLFLKLSYNGKTVTKTFNFIVIKNENLFTLEAVFDSCVKFDKYVIDENLVLPTSYIMDGEEVKATWTSSDEKIIENNGTIHFDARPKTCTLKLKIEVNDTYKEKEYTFTVVSDPALAPSETYHLANVYTDEIKDEVKKPNAPSIFQGAVYHKVVSSVDYWLGIEAIVTLPTFTEDPARYDASRPYTKYLDNASLYMGGHAAYESDIGLTWSIGYLSPDDSGVTDYGFCFRPFWRYITKKEPGKEGIQSNIYKNADPRDYEFYYYPGDTVRMSVFSSEPGYLQLRIELLELTTIPKYVAQRAKYNLGDDFERVFLTPSFHSESMGVAKSEFKRVNAIDQANNEGKQTLNTNAKYENAIWHEVYLYRNIDGSIYKVPMNERRCSSINAPYGLNANGDFSKAFTLTYDGVDTSLGGEIVSICPNNGTGKLYNSSPVIYDPDKKKI